MRVVGQDKKELDWESIRSSPRDGSSTSYRLTKGWLGFGGWVGGWLGVVGCVVGPQDFCVIPGVLKLCIN